MVPLKRTRKVIRLWSSSRHALSFASPHHER
jgi:hypothetical protein